MHTRSCSFALLLDRELPPCVPCCGSALCATQPLRVRVCRLLPPLPHQALPAALCGLEGAVMKWTLRCLPNQCIELHTAG
eukprot:COSAG03_NODE_13417_length_504_cov_0.627160_1_plen_79_part_01